MPSTCSVVFLSSWKKWKPVIFQGKSIRNLTNFRQKSKEFKETVMTSIRKSKNTVKNLKKRNYTNFTENYRTFTTFSQVQKNLKINFWIRHETCAVLMTFLHWFFLGNICIDFFCKFKKHLRISNQTSHCSSINLMFFVSKRRNSKRNEKPVIFREKSVKNLTNSPWNVRSSNGFFIPVLNVCNDLFLKFKMSSKISNGTS